MGYTVSIMQKNRRKEKRESFWYRPFWATLAPLVYRYLCFGGNHFIIHRLPPPLESPSIIISNHACFFDWLFAAKALGGLKPHFIMSRYYLDGKSYKWFFDDVGIFGKSVFSDDMQSAIQSIRLLRSGGTLALFPEARLSASHKGEIIPDETPSFIKRLGLPVYAVRVEGASLMMPKWGHLNRHSRVEVHAEKLFDGPELKHMDISLVSEKIVKSISYDDEAYLADHPEIHYRFKNGAEGIENVLFRCPVCHEEFTIVSKGFDVECTHCGYSVKMDDRYGFTPSNPMPSEMAWFAWQREAFREEIVADPAFKLVSHCRIKLQKEYVGEGTVSLSREGLFYDGTDIDGELHIAEPLSSFFVLPFKAGDNFVLFKGKRCYVFCPDNGKEAIKFNLASDVLQKLAREEKETDKCQDTKCEEKIPLTAKCPLHA